MFTGIIEELGAIDRLDPLPAGARIRVRCHQVLQDIQPGASIAAVVNACTIRPISSTVSGRQVIHGVQCDGTAEAETGTCSGSKK